MRIALLRGQSIMHALKGQQRLAQGKRSDTLGQSTFVSDAL